MKRISLKDYEEVEIFIKEFENTLCYNVIDEVEIINWKEFITYKEWDSVVDLENQFDGDYWLGYDQLNEQWSAMPKLFQQMALDKDNIVLFKCAEMAKGHLPNISRYLDNIMNEVQATFNDIENVRL